jgi:CheY-like chemotaxis protein
VANRILIVDDDITALDIVDILFEGQGFEVIRHPSALSALENLQEAKPDVILIDLMMPRMAGQECVRQMRSQGIKVPIVAFTALDDPRVHQEACDAGCTKVLLKPCKSKELVKEIESLLPAVGSPSCKN